MLWRVLRFFMSRAQQPERLSSTSILTVSCTSHKKKNTGKDGIMWGILRTFGNDLSSMYSQW